MTYSPRIKSSAVKALKRIDKANRIRVVAAIDGLKETPHQGTLLKGGLSGLRRIRVGDYRVIYEAHDSALIVHVIHLGHRRDVYR